MTDPKNLDEALHMFQANLPTLVKDKSGQVGNQKTKYADLAQANEVVLKRLNELGVIWVCKPTLREEDPKFVLRYRLTHVPSSTSEAGDYPLKLSDNPMQMGSAVTYSRRYALLAITGVVSEDEDDDGNAAASSGQRHAQRAGRSHAAASAEQGQQGQQAQRNQRPRAGQPPLPGESPDGPVDQRRMRAMHALWAEVGFGGEENRENRLNLTARFAGLESLDSSSNLTQAQADAVIEALRERKAQMGGSE